MKPSRPVLLALSILAGLKVLTSAAVFADLIGDQATGLIVAALAALDVGMAFYLQGQVTPFADVMAYRRDDTTLAGPAFHGVPTGRPVTVKMTSPHTLPKADPPPAGLTRINY